MVTRPSAIALNYTVNDLRYLSPEDPKAGGTWYVVDKKMNTVLVLLNGARKAYYKIKFIEEPWIDCFGYHRNVSLGILEYN
jgi:hypothetical protein